MRFFEKNFEYILALLEYVCIIITIEAKHTEGKKMENIINKLEKISNRSNERVQRNISNLICRIKEFEKQGNEEKLNECKAEAELWGC